MIIETHIQKWGNSLGLRVSGAMRAIPGFESGMAVQVEITEDGLNIHKTRKKKKLNKKELRRRMRKIFPYSEKELIAGLRPDMYDEFDFDPLPSETDV